jgi:hypothetical protein
MMVLLVWLRHMKMGLHVCISTCFITLSILNVGFKLDALKV